MGNMWLTATKSLVVSSNPVIYIYQVASVVIPYRMDSYKG